MHPLTAAAGLVELQLSFHHVDVALGTHGDILLALKRCRERERTRFAGLQPEGNDFIRLGHHQLARQHNAVMRVPSRGHTGHEIEIAAIVGRHLRSRCRVDSAQRDLRHLEIRSPAE